MNVHQLQSELEERGPDADVEVRGNGPIIDIEMTNDGKYILIGGNDES
jgi:hypothetical protein